jgi:hypothetical protein
MLYSSAFAIDFAPPQEMFHNMAYTLLSTKSSNRGSLQWWASEWFKNLPFFPPMWKVLFSHNPKNLSPAPFEAVLARDGFFMRTSGGKKSLVTFKNSRPQSPTSIWFNDSNPERDSRAQTIRRGPGRNGRLRKIVARGHLLTIQARTRGVSRHSAACNSLSVKSFCLRSAAPGVGHRFNASRIPSTFGSALP